MRLSWCILTLFIGACSTTSLSTADDMANVIADDGGNGAESGTDDGAVSLPVDMDVPDHAASCVQTLANVGAGDFTIRFTLNAVAPPTWFSTVLYQRNVSCNDLSKDYWVLFLGSDGTLRMTMNQGGGAYTKLDATISIGRTSASFSAGEVL